MSSENPAGDTKGTGTDSLEIAQVDPNASRKAIIARHNALSQADREIDLATVPGAAALQAGYEEQEGAQTPDGDTAGEGAVQTPRAAPVASEPVAGVDSAPTPSGETVTLKVFGKDVVESREKVEAAGGVEARQIQLGVEHRLQQAEDLARRDERLRQFAADKRREFEDRLSRLSQPAPAQVQPAPASTQSRPAAETTAPAGNVEDQAAHLVAELYSGDPDRAATALSEVLKLRESGRHTAADPNEIAALVQAKVESDMAARESKNAANDQVNAVNELMESKYGTVLGDPVLRAAAAQMYNNAIKDPGNKGRPLVKIADEVGTLIMSRVDGGVKVPDADINAAVNTRTNFKRRIPQPSSASERVPSEPAEPKYPTKPSDVVNMYRAARHQPLQ